MSKSTENELHRCYKCNSTPTVVDNGGDIKYHCCNGIKYTYSEWNRVNSQMTLLRDLITTAFGSK